jgi:hypothetical protein
MTGIKMAKVQEAFLNITSLFQTDYLVMLEFLRASYYFFT